MKSIIGTLSIEQSEGSGVVKKVTYYTVFISTAF